MADTLPLSVPSSPDTVPFDTGLTTPGPLPNNIAAPRAFRASYGLGRDMGMSYEDMYHHISSGDEAGLREQAAATVNAQNAQNRHDIIASIARQRGGMTEGDYKVLDLRLMREGVAKPVSSGSVFEEKFFRKYMDAASLTGFTNTSSRMYDALQEVPTQVEELKSYGTSALAKDRIAANKLEEMQVKYQNQSWGSYGLDLLKDLGTLGLYSEYNLRGNVPGTNLLSGLGLGSNLEEQAKKLAELPVDEYEKTLTKALDILEAKAPFLAVQFAQAVKGQTIAEESLNNFFTAVTLTGLKPIIAGKGAAFALRKVGLINGAKEDVGAMMRSATQGGADTQALILESSGNLKEAGVAKFVADTAKAAAGKPADLTEMKEALPSVLNAFDKNPGNHSRETVNRLKTVTERDTNNLVSTVTNMAKMDVDPLVSFDAIARRAWDVAKSEFKDVDILDAGSVIKPTGNNRFSYNIDIGKPGAELFFSPQVAENYAKVQGFTGYKVIPAENKANGYVIRFDRSLHADESVQAPIPTKSPAPTSWLDYIPGVSKYRTSEETLTEANRENRKVAVYGQTELYRLAATIGEDLKKLTRGASLWKTPMNKRWEDFKTVLNAAAKDIDPKDGKRGWFFDNPTELDAYYVQTLKRTPDEAEVLGYFSYKRLMEMKRYLDNRQAYVNKVRVGTETHTIDALNEAGQTKTFSFDGVRMKEFPRGDDAVLYLGKEAQSHDMFYLGNMNPKTLGALEKRVANGEVSVLKVYNTKDRPFENFEKVGNTRIGYVITENGVKSEPISFDQIPRRLRPDLEYNHAYAIKQANIRQEGIRKITRSVYEGDTYIMPISIREMGRDVANKLDKVRVMIKDNQLDAAKEFTKNNLPVEWDEVHSWFKYDVTSEGLPIPPRLNLNEPIQLVRNNQKIGHVGNELEKRYTSRDLDGNVREFKDGTRMDLASQHNFDPNRPDNYGLFSLKNEGTKGNPTYKIAPADYVDMIPTMQRGVGKMIRTTFMSDYKRLSVKEWLDQAQEHLRDGDRAGQSPYYFFEQGVFKPGTAPEVKNRLETQRFQIKQLLSIPDEVENGLHSMAEQMNDWIYGKLGQRAAERLSPTWLLPRLADPTQFLRTVTFHSTLGLWNVPQLMVQMNTFSTILGIAGYKMAAPGTKAALMHMYMGVNASPALLAKFDNMATKQLLPGTSRWLPGQLTEAFEAGKSTGFFNVGKEYALDVYNPKVLTSTAGDILDTGTFFFRQGEKSVRAGAWYTAYREFRDANPTARLTNADIKTILNRADLLSVNMSRASNSMLHTGIMSVPAQFLSYQIRLSELFMGKRLSQTERARLLGTYSALYGVPSGLALTGIPFTDYFRKAATENGYVVGDNYLETMATEGFGSLMAGLITEKTTGKPTYLNFPERYGSSGFEPIREALRSDQSWLKLAGGAAFGKLGSMFANYDPFLAATQSAFRGDGKFTLHADDFLKVAKEISSVNAGIRAYVAFNTSNWISKNETILDKNISPGLATFMTISGTAPQRAQDAYLKIWSTKDMEKSHETGIKLFIKEYGRAIDVGEANKEQALEYQKNAYAYLKAYGVPMKDWHKALSMATEGRKDLVSKIDWQFFVTKSPEDQKQIRRDAWRKIQEQKAQ